ncbi:golgin subfamily A member 6-like protein 1 [Camponotus floridanus]|uniref:golgin subfamily A member 6-like protein 1 n=1 Tax=Camponotus floridanus TaxID=104421 RepID=UPI000DC670E7|nr:golgin subfamily A member 6-like protein 1 [Camponotus floridanus]
MYFNKKLKSSLEEKQKDEEERRMKRREQWHREQRILREHEERKIKMIQNFERNRAQEIVHKQKLQQNESNNPQRRTDYKYPEELKISSSKYQRSTIIEEKELKKIKVKIYCEETHKTRNKNISTDKIERDICNPDDIVLQRREYESIGPIFEKIKTAQDKMQTLEDKMRDNKLEKKVSDEESIDIRKNKSIYKYKIIPQYRKQSKSTRQNEEEDRNKNERRTSSLSRCNSDIASTVRDRSRFRRSRSNSSSNRATKEEQDFNENKFSSRRNFNENKFSSRRNFNENKFSSGSHKPYDGVSHAELATSYPSSYNFYDTCMRFPGPMPMYRMQTPPMMWPIAPRPFPPPFPPNMIRWRPNPPRFSNVDRGFYRN